jgi:hypothetical protein
MSNFKETDVYEGNVDGGETFTLSLDTQRTDEIVILIDDGSKDRVPPEYTLTERVYSHHFDSMMYLREFTTETSRSWQMSASNKKHEFTFENTDLQAGDFRVYAYTF